MSRSPATLPPTWIDPIFVVPSCANRKKGVCGPCCTPKFYIYVAHTSWARFTINTTKTSLRLVDERGIWLYAQSHSGWGRNSAWNAPRARAQQRFHEVTIGRSSDIAMPRAKERGHRDVAPRFSTVVQLSCSVPRKSSSTPSRPRHGNKPRSGGVGEDTGHMGLAARRHTSQSPKLYVWPCPERVDDATRKCPPTECWLGIVAAPWRRLAKTWRNHQF